MMKCKIDWRLIKMPCMCWFDPPEESKKLVKFHCEKIIEELKRLHTMGDPFDLQLADIKNLLDHLWNPKDCDKK